jgi:hypothetical protein
MRGDEEPAPVAERPWFREVLAEPDPRRRLALVARNARAVRGRTAAVTEIVRQAAAVEPEIGALRDRFELELHDVGMRRIAETLAADGALAGDVAAATDILWALVHPDLHQLLVHRRGWTPEAYEVWLAAALCRELLAGG